MNGCDVCNLPISPALKLQPLPWPRTEFVEGLELIIL